MEDAVDSRSAGEFQRVHLIARALDPLLEVHAELLHHPTHTHTVV